MNLRTSESLLCCARIAARKSGAKVSMSLLPCGVPIDDRLGLSKYKKWQQAGMNAFTWVLHVPKRSGIYSDQRLAPEL